MWSSPNRDDDWHAARHNSANTVTTEWIKTNSKWSFVPGKWLYDEDCVLYSANIETKPHFHEKQKNCRRKYFLSGVKWSFGIIPDSLSPPNAVLFNNSTWWRWFVFYNCVSLCQEKQLLKEQPALYECWHQKSIPKRGAHSSFRCAGQRAAWQCNNFAFWFSYLGSDCLQAPEERVPREYQLGGLQRLCLSFFVWCT